MTGQDQKIWQVVQWASFPRRNGMLQFWLCEMDCKQPLIAIFNAFRKLHLSWMAYMGWSKPYFRIYVSHCCVRLCSTLWTCRLFFIVDYIVEREVEDKTLRSFLFWGCPSSFPFILNCRIFLSLIDSFPLSPTLLFLFTSLYFLFSFLFLSLCISFIRVCH